MSLVLVLIADPAAAPLDLRPLDAAAGRLAAEGVGVGPIHWLAAGAAAERPVAAAVAERDRLAGLLAEALAAWPVDVALLPAEGRRKRLLIADMDSTILTGETLDELAAHAGIGAEIAAITARAMRGELDFPTALRERVAMIAGLEEAALEATAQRLALMPGAAALVRTMAAHGAFTALVSGGFDYFTGRVRRLVGFDHDEANRLEIAEGRLTGRVIEPILGRDAKRAALLRLAQARGLAPADCLAVGDGANDIDMIRTAGLGVAFRAKPAVAAQAPVRIDHGDLTALLYLQGFSHTDLCGATLPGNG